MPISISRGGRPYLMADIDFENDPDLPLWDEFFSICRDFQYREIMAISRAFGVDPSTVERWKYGLTFPARRGVAALIIQWARNGKPMRKVSPSQNPVSMV